MIYFRQKAFTEYEAMRTLYETIRNMTHGDMRKFPVIDQSSLVPILKGNNIVVERFVITTSLFGKDKYRMYLKIGARAKLPDQVRLPQAREYDKRLGNLSLSMNNSIPQSDYPDFYEDKAKNAYESFDFYNNFENSNSVRPIWGDKGRLRYEKKQTLTDTLDNALAEYEEGEEWNNSHPDFSRKYDNGKLRVFRKRTNLDEMNEAISKYKNTAQRQKEVDEWNKKNKKNNLRIEWVTRTDSGKPVEGHYEVKKFSDLGQCEFSNNNNKDKARNSAIAFANTSVDIKYKVRELLGEAVKYDKPGRSLVLEFKSPEDAVRALNILPFGIGYKIYLLNA